MKRLLSIVILLVSATPALATNSPIELKTALQTLMTQLPGEYDNAAQLYFEEETKVPKELQHQRVYRTFTKIDAPDVGANVLVATVHSRDKYSKFDEAEFQVWTLTVDDARQVVRMSPRKFAEPAKYIPIATDAAKLKGLSAGELVPAKGAAGCDILWRLNGAQLLGRTDPGTCATRMARLQIDAVFNWEWLLTEDELWITFDGRDPAGKLIMGRPDQTHWRLGKAHDFECFLSYRPKKGEAQVNNGFHMHDRGDIYRWQIVDGRKTTPVFATLLRGMWPSNSGRNYTDLLRIDVYAGTPDQPKDKWEYLGGSFASADSDRTGFTTPTLAGRCKVAN